MGPLERTVATTVHGTYLVELPPGGPVTPPLLVGFHGYAETAARHLEELRRIPGAAGWLLCAVQAPHPFYTRANEGAASWMPRHDRERAIADNVAYVAAVVSELEREF